MALRILRVDGSRGLARFVDVPWRVLDRRTHPVWVPPLRSQVRDLLDKARNPFFRRADRALFIAEQEGRPVGRIAAIENRAHNEFHSDRVGFFGFFESVDDPAVAGALLDAAAEWLGERGLTSIRGPVNPSTNYDCGMLVDGFETPPAFLTTWNPPYYMALMEASGMRSAKELVGYFLPTDDATAPVPERVRKLAERVRRQTDIQFRSLDPSRYREEVDRVWSVYAAAWENNWGFVPVGRDEFDFMAKDLEHLLIKDFVFFAEKDGETIGFLLLVMDYSPILARIGNGRLFPTGIFRMLLGKKALRKGRVMAVGIKPEHRRRGIMGLFLDEIRRRGKAYGGVGADASWILEDNRLIRQPIEELGGILNRRWRIWERDLAEASGQ